MQSAIFKKERKLRKKLVRRVIAVLIQDHPVYHYMEMRVDLFSFCWYKRNKHTGS